MPGANSSGLEENPDGMRFGRSRDKSFVENAEERVSEKFKNNDWKVLYIMTFFSFYRRGTF